jgi:hypothetical protein
MKNDVGVIVFAIVAALLGGVEVIRSRAQSLLAWGLVAVAVAVIITQL